MTANHPNIKSIAVYCGSSSKVDPIFFKEATRLGQIMAENGIDLVYGAGNMGLMGAVANATMQHGGKVVGVIPAFMVEANWHHSEISELIVTADMHERKATMAQRSDAVVALPGGIGTFEELFEILTWKQLGLVTKPIVILNINHYYDPIIQMLDRAIDQQFMREMQRSMWCVVESADLVLDAIKHAPTWDPSVRKIAAI